MKNLAIKTILLLVITLSLNVLGINAGILGSIIIMLCLSTGIVLAGLRHRNTMPVFAFALFTFTTRPLPMAAYWVIFGLAVFCLWAWDNQRKIEKTENKEVSL